MNIQLKDHVRRLGKIAKTIWLKLTLQHKSPQSQARTGFHIVVDTGFPPANTRPGPYCSTLAWWALAVTSREWGRGLGNGLVHPVKCLHSWTG